MMKNTIIASLAFALNLVATIKAQTCSVPELNQKLGTNNYLLYGLTADCQIFFATNVPNGTDLGQMFGPQINATRANPYTDCQSARLFPIKNANNQLKLLLVFLVAPQIYAHVLDFQVPKDNWFSLLTGPNNGPVISQISAATLNSSLSMAAFPATAQVATDSIIAFVNQTSNQFTIFTRPTPSSVPSNMMSWSVNSNNIFQLTANETNVLLKPSTYTLFTDPYMNNIYVIDPSYIYRYPNNPMSSISAITIPDTPNKISYTADGHRFNYYVVNGILFRLQYQSSNLANIIVQTIPTTLNATQYMLNNIPSMCIGQLFQPNASYNNVQNFQMSAVFLDDYSAVMAESAQKGIHEGCSLKLLSVLALAVLYRELH